MSESMPHTLAEKHPLSNDDATVPSDGVSVLNGEVIAPFEREAKVHFSLWHTLGISFSITAAPISMGAYLALAIGVGGPPVYFGAYIFSVGLNMFVCVSLAEMASAFPHSSGHIYWTSILAPKKVAAQLSYFVGWLTGAAWLFGFAATLLYLAELLLALVEVCYASYEPHQWHDYLLYIAFGVVCLVLNLPGFFRIHPTLMASSVPVINGSAIFLLISLLVRATPKRTAYEVFSKWVNETGWDSDGVVFFLGILPGIAAVNAFDCATHVTDEVDNPGKIVPQVMIGSAIMSAVAGLGMTILFLFCITNADGLLEPVGGQPIVQLMVDGYRSTPLTIVGTVCVIVSFFIAAVGILTTFSRFWWSFARNGGVPFAPMISKLTSKEKLPVNSLLCCFVLAIILGSIQMGSTTALNAILGGTNICYALSYMTAISSLLWRGRSCLPKDRYFSLGKVGPFINVVAIVWSIFVVVWLCFPLYLPVTAESMNYASAILGAVVILATINWFVYSKHRQVRIEQAREQ